LARAADRRIPIAPVYDLAQALDAPFTRRTGMVASVAHPARPACACSPIR